MVGVQVDRNKIDNTAGSLANDVRLCMERAAAFKAWLDTKTDQGLIDLSYSVAEVADLRSAYGDLDQLATIFRGTANLASAKDFRTFAKRLWGFGL